MKYAALVAVGPEPVELDRVADLIDSIRAYEDWPCTFVMVDDAAEPRDLKRRFDVPANWTVWSVRHPRHEDCERAARAARASKGKGLCSAILQGLRCIAGAANVARFTLKLDTDALVIAPFADKILAALERNPDVGMIGAYDRTPNGDVRDISRNAKNVEGLYRGVGLVRKIKNRLINDELSQVSRHIGAALSHGYRFGEHCLGGAYAVSDELPRRMKAADYLDDPARWLPVDCPEDVMVGMYTKAVDLRHLGFVGPGEVFGVRHRGLADSPQRLVERGFSVIHAVKNDPNHSEDDIRRFFRGRRRSVVAAQMSNP
jgi:NAD(P)-dependent dehydrogenase (short-subunit alcohol dehydrogenase family)